MSGKVKELPRPKKSFSLEFKDEAVKMVIETSRPIARVAKELGINEGTLGNWVSAYRREHAGEEPPLTVNERARRVRFFEGCAIPGCFGHAASPRRAMLSGS
jgi:transposase